MVYKNISVKAILEGLYRDNNISEEVNFLDCVEWAGECLESIGAYSQFVQKSTDLELENYRVLIPCDFHKMLGATYKGLPIVEASSNYGNIVPSTTTDSSQFLVNNTSADLPQSVNSVGDEHYTYLINDSYFVSNLKEGTITMSYLAFPVDDCGFPMIPDNYYYKKAVQMYITYMIDRAQWRVGRIPDKVYQESKNDWQWYVQAARSAGLFPNIDGMENFKRMWLKLVPNVNEYNGLFKDLAKSEKLKIVL